MSEKSRKYPFLGPEELNQAHTEYQEDSHYARMYGQSPTTPIDKITQWKDSSLQFEGKAGEGYYYPTIRREGQPIGRRPLESYHGESFIAWISSQLQNRNSKKPLTVLDVGGGCGLYTEQLRKQFGASVKVYSTGLRKAPARMERAILRKRQPDTVYRLPDSISIEPKIHKDDLRWRSLLQLRDTEEFDLIVDTGGEFAYGVESIENARRYILAIIHKLRVGGKASISFINEAKKVFLDPVLREIKQDKKYTNICTFEIKKNNDPSIFENDPEFILKVYKINSLRE